MATAAQPDPQTSLYETTIEDPELERLLEDRQKRKETASDAQRKASAAHELVKEKINVLDIADGPVRVGRFVVAVKPVKAREVSFTANATERLQIKLLPEA